MSYELKNKKRIIHCEDAIAWLNNYNITENQSFVASLPDISEFTNYSLSTWKEWFINTASLVIQKTADYDVTLFFQTDIKIEGLWIDKGYLCQSAAEEYGSQLLWHKVICRAPAGMATFGRPAYSHLLCFSKKLSLDISKSTPDVIPDMGDKTWERGMGFEVCNTFAKFVSEQTKSSVIVHPFCGEGSMLAMANHFNLDAIGIERSPKRARKAQELQVSMNKKTFLLI